MFDLKAFIAGFAVILTVACVTWCVSLAKLDVSIIDSMWPLFFVAAATTYAATVPQPGPRASWAPVLVAAWPLRLSGYLTWRKWGRPEDQGYEAIRRRVTCL